MVWNLAALRVRRWEMPTSLASPTSTSPGPTPAKQTSADHRELHQATWCTAAGRRTGRARHATRRRPTMSPGRCRHARGRHRRGSRDRATHARPATAARRHHPTADGRCRCPVVRPTRRRRTRSLRRAEHQSVGDRARRTSPIVGCRAAGRGTRRRRRRPRCSICQDGIVSWRARGTASRPPGPD